MPHPARHDERQHRRDRHGAGDRDSIRRREAGRGSEAKHQRDDAGEQRAIDPGQVDLADFTARRVLHLHPRNVTQLHCLLRDRECAGDDRLRCNDRGHRCQRDEGIERPRRSEQVERVGHGPGVVDQQCPLAEIVEREGGQNESRPGEAHRPAAEVPHVRVERLGAGDHEHDRAEGEEAERAVGGKEADRVKRIERGQNLRRPGDADRAQHSQRDEPDDHDRAEQCAHAPGAALLNDEQREHDDQRDRYDVSV